MQNRECGVATQEPARGAQFHLVSGDAPPPVAPDHHVDDLMARVVEPGGNGVARPQRDLVLAGAPSSQDRDPQGPPGVVPVCVPVPVVIVPVVVEPVVAGLKRPTKIVTLSVLGIRAPALGAC